MSPFLDFLSDKEHKGDPLKMSHQWPPPEGIEFVHKEIIEEEGFATIHHGRLLAPNNQGVPTWTWASMVYPHNEDVFELALTYYGAMVQGGPKIIQYCKRQGCEFIALEALDEFKSMRLKQYIQFRADVGSNFTDEKERMESIAYELTRHVVNIHDSGVYHRDLGVHSVVVSNFALKTTFGAGDVHLTGFERAGTVSDRFRNENMDKESRNSNGKDEMFRAVEGDERLLRAKDMLGHKRLPKIADPMALDFSLGLESQPLSRDVVGIVNEKLLDRYLLADTVFHMFGGKIDGPKPDRIPDDLYAFLIGLSTSDMTKRFHQEAQLKKHRWMQRRAAITAAVLEGRKPADVEPPIGQTMKTLWRPAQTKQASSMRDVKDTINPVDLLARIAKGSGGAGAAAAEVEAGAASLGSMAKVQQVPPGSPSGSGSWSWSGLGLPTVSESDSSPDSGRVSWADSEESGKESEDGGGRSCCHFDEDTGMGKGKRKGEGRETGEGKGLGGESEKESGGGGDRSSPPFGMGKGLWAGKGERGVVEMGERMGKGERKGMGEGMGNGEESEMESGHFGDRSSPPFGLGKGLWAGKGSGMVFDTSEDEGKAKDKDVQMTADVKTRVMPTRSTTVAAGISGSDKAGAGSANTIRTESIYKRKRRERDEYSDSFDDTSSKRRRLIPSSDGGSPCSEAPYVPEAVAGEAMAVPDGSTLIRPFMGSDVVEPYSPSDLYTIDENAYDDMQWCSSGVSDHGADPYSASDIEEDINNW